MSVNSKRVFYVKDLAHPVYAETTKAVRPLRELRFSADVMAGS